MIALPRLRICLHTLGLPVTGEDPAHQSLGGSETAVISMARALARRGHEVTVLANVARPARVAGVDYRPAAETGSPAAGGPPDVFIAARHLAVLERPLPARLVGLWHHDMPAGNSLAQFPRAWSRARFSFFVSRFQLEAFERVVPGVSETAWLTTNGIDFDALEAALTGAPPRPRAPRFVYASRPERGLELLLRRVWPRLRERLPEAELWLSTYDCSSLRAHPDFERHVTALYRLAERSPGVALLGNLSRSEFWRRLAGSTAVLYPAAYPEVSCMVALEAQGAGVPILTSDAFALSETVAWEEARVSGRPGSAEYVDELVERAVRLAGDSDFHRRAVAAGREHVSRATHSWDALAERWSAGLAERLESPTPRPRVSATLLVKDEGDQVERSIESLAAAVDEIVVGDTGASEATRAALDRLGFVQPRGDGPADREAPERRVVPIDFVDFAQARNELARHATGDWIVWQDADEELHGGAELRRWIDENTFFDAFALEQRHATVEGQVAPNHPLRGFRRETPDGPLAWFGCVHEYVEHGLDRPPRRVLRLPDVWVAHYGYTTRAVREAKARDRNFFLLVRDRRLNPERRMGLVLGLRECLNIAKYEIASAGELTTKAYRHLQLGFEIWRRHVDHFPDRYRAVGFPYSREILAMLAHHRLPLEATGRIPLEADFSFAAARGGLEVAGRNIPRQRVFYADAEELRREIGRRLDRLEGELGTLYALPPENLPPPAPELAEIELAPELLGLEPAPVPDTMK